MVSAVGRLPRTALRAGRRSRRRGPRPTHRSGRSLGHAARSPRGRPPTSGGSGGEALVSSRTRARRAPVDARTGPTPGPPRSSRRPPRVRNAALGSPPTAASMTEREPWLSNAATVRANDTDSGRARTRCSSAAATPSLTGHVLGQRVQASAHQRAELGDRFLQRQRVARRARHELGEDAQARSRRRCRRPSRRRRRGPARPGRAPSDRPGAPRRVSPDRTVATNATASSPRRRAAKARAWAEPGSSQCQSSMNTISGPRWAATASRPSVAVATANRSGSVAGPSANALRSAAAWRAGSASRPSSTGRSTPSRPPKPRPDSVGTAVVVQQRHVRSLGHDLSKDMSHECGLADPGFAPDDQRRARRPRWVPTGLSTAPPAPLLAHTASIASYG